MITGSAASMPTRTAPSGAAPIPGAATAAGRAEKVAGETTRPSGIDRITLTPAPVRLDLLMKGAGAQLRDMDALLLATSGSVSDPAAMDTHDVARLVRAARNVVAAVETLTNANTIAGGKGLPGQAEQVVALVAHACSSLQAATVRLMRAQATAGGALAEDRVASFHDRDRAGMRETLRRVEDTGCEPANRVAAEPPDATTIAAALAAMQEIATRLARLRTTSPASGACSASPLSRQEEAAIRVASGVQRPVLPGLVCVLVALVLLQRIDPGPVQHIATLLVLPMALAWCGHWLVRRRRNDRRRETAWCQDGVSSDASDASMSITVAPGADHAVRAAPLA